MFRQSLLHILSSVVVSLFSTSCTRTDHMLSQMKWTLRIRFRCLFCARLCLNGMAWPLNWWIYKTIATLHSGSIRRTDWIEWGWGCPSQTHAHTHCGPRRHVAHCSEMTTNVEEDAYCRLLMWRWTLDYKSFFVHMSSNRHANLSTSLCCRKFSLLPICEQTQNPRRKNRVHTFKLKFIFTSSVILLLFSLLSFSCIH